MIFSASPFEIALPPFFPISMLIKPTIYVCSPAVDAPTAQSPAKAQKLPVPHDRALAVSTNTVLPATLIVAAIPREAIICTHVISASKMEPICPIKKPLFAITTDEVAGTGTAPVPEATNVYHPVIFFALLILSSRLSKYCFFDILYNSCRLANRYADLQITVRGTRSYVKAYLMLPPKCENLLSCLFFGDNILWQKASLLIIEFYVLWPLIEQVQIP